MGTRCKHKPPTPDDGILGAYAWLAKAVAFVVVFVVGIVAGIAWLVYKLLQM